VAIAPIRIKSSDSGSGCHGAWGRSPSASVPVSPRPSR